MTAEWEMLKDLASDKALRRHEIKVRKYNAKPWRRTKSRRSRWTCGTTSTPDTGS
ncbi:hypothetical protein NKG94_34670 [Micromonospora sp. M12]